ncbi:MAG: NAD+ synthase [Mariprofundaceae bacterium]|nr:NAD+ synthase [Mariprofundaceae bacterium]
MKIMLAQCMPRVGALAHNASMMETAIQQAIVDHCDLIVFPELVLTAYPPEDLLLLPAFMQKVETMLERIIQTSHGIAVLFGYPSQAHGTMHNSLLVAHKGKPLFFYHKQQLPNYGVFDERRYFTPGDHHQALYFTLNNTRVGVAICEDLWQADFAKRMQHEAVDCWITIHASPFQLGKQKAREQLTCLRAKENNTAIIYLNMVGGQDELVFDGGSHVATPQGIAMRLGQFKTANRVFCLPFPYPKAVTPPLEEMAQLHGALVLGLRDYVRRNGGARVVLGLSGGIDSALTAVIAVDALGCDAVLGVLLPSCFSSDHSIDDAKILADNLGMAHCLLPISTSVQSVENSLKPLFDAWGYNGIRNVCEENIQARTRGLLLMAISNKTGRMLLTTGNKSELAVGYATLYGDMCGAYSVLKDVYKTQVFALARWINTQQSPCRIPQNSIDKPPSAELAPDQRDEDSLPPYDQLDAILLGLIEAHQSSRELISQGHDGNEVLRIERMLHQMEFKRRQSPPGVKVTSCAFGKERRFPMTHGFYKEIE